MANVLPDYDYTIRSLGTTVVIECGSWILANVLENILDEFNVDYKKYWQSKYNSFIVYDYEPFCVEGFNVGFRINCNSLNAAGYIKYIAEKEFNKRINLEKVAMLDIDLQTEDGLKIKELQEV